MYETQAELIGRGHELSETKQELIATKEELESIRKENDELKNQMAANNLMEIVKNFQTTFSTSLEEIQESLKSLSLRVSHNGELITASDTRSTTVKNELATLSEKVSNYDNGLFELNENLRKLHEILNRHDKILNQYSEIQAKQNKTTQVSIINENNLEKQTILLLGGEDGMNNDSLMLLENNGQNWKQLNVKLPYAVSSHGAQFLNNNIYIFGGENTKYEPLNWTYKLSKSLQWEKVADMNKKRKYISNSSVILNNQIWVCGGRNDKLEDLKSVEMYDPQTNKWKYMKEMNKCRASAAAAVVNGKIYCSGWYKSVECYDPSSDVWTIICDMPKEIWGHSAVEIDGNLIIVGGRDVKEFLKNIWTLDTTDKNAKWIEKRFMYISRRDFSVAKIDDKIFVCGGEYEKSAEIFYGKNWSFGPSMPTIRRNAPAVVIPMGFARELEQFIADPLEPSKESSLFEYLEDGWYYDLYGFYTS